VSVPKVLFVSHSGAVSGAERVLLDVVGAFPKARAFVFEPGDLPTLLTKAGIETTVSTGGATLAGARRDSSLRVILPLASALFGLTRELMAAMKDCDVVYANSQKAFTLAAMACLFRRKPLVWHLHDILSPAHFGTLQRQLQTRLANLVARCVIVPSGAAAEAFIVAGGKAKLVAVVPNGVSRIPDPRPKAELRRALGLPEDGFLAGVFSRISPWKGQDIVLQALADQPGVTGVFAGSALFGEEAYATKLQRLVRELGLENRAIFLGQRSDILPLMQAMDVVIHPSTEPEPFGLTLVEAMLANTPLLASDAGASAEILDNGVFGTLFAPADPAALVAALTDMARIAKERPDDLVRRTEAARERALTTYSVVRMNTAITGWVTAAAR
jgi:glycosyltransferase involved in cell wall biosynthesis